MVDLVNRLIGGIFPSRCAVCGLLCQGSLSLCSTCEAELQRNIESCYRCAIPLPPGGIGPRECGACQQRPPAFDRAIVPWLYCDHLAQLIQQWKYGRQLYLNRALARLWLQGAGPAPGVDLLVPVPLHWRKQWRRGFNQSELLARQLIRQCPDLASSGIDNKLVRRRRPTAAQPGMGATQRRRNLSGAFTSRRACDSLRIAIVDDVLTTGATANELAGVLRRAGASHVEVWCLARTPRPGA